MIDLPPEKFDHSYEGPVIEQLMSAQEISDCCGIDTAQACMFPPNFLGDKCFIYLPWIGPGGVAKRTQDLLRRHEIGHCNGWRH